MIKFIINVITRTWSISYDDKCQPSITNYITVYRIFKFKIRPKKCTIFIYRYRSNIAKY